MGLARAASSRDPAIAAARSRRPWWLDGLATRIGSKVDGAREGYVIPSLSRDARPRRSTSLDRFGAGMTALGTDAVRRVIPAFERHASGPRRGRTVQDWIEAVGGSAVQPFFSSTSQGWKRVL